MLYVDDIIVNPEEAPMVPARTPASLSEMGIGVIEAHWGESSVQGTAISTANGGQRLVDRRGKPTTVELTLMVREDRAEEVDLPAAAYRFQQIFGPMQERETWIMRVPYLDDFAGPILYKITGVVSLGDFLGWGKGEQPDVTLTLERDPVGYSTEEDESAVVSTAAGARQLIYELPAGKGTADGLQRIRITNNGTASGETPMSGLIWARECRDAPDDLSDPTAALAYLAKNLTPVGGASVKTTGDGAQVVKHSSLTADWLPVLHSKIAGVGQMTHRGQRRMWFRLLDESPLQDLQLQLLWRDLGGSHWVDDTPIISAPNVTGWALVTAGIARPQLPVIGEAGWEWELMARATGGSGSVSIRDAYPMPTEQYLELSEPPNSAAPDDRICFESRSLELRSDGCFRQGREDDVWGPLVPDGFLPYAPAGGIEGRPSRDIIIASTGPLDEGDGETMSFDRVVWTREGYHFAREAT